RPALRGWCFDPARADRRRVVRLRHRARGAAPQVDHHLLPAPSRVAEARREPDRHARLLVLPARRTELSLRRHRRRPCPRADGRRAARERLVETIAEANDALLERYLEGVELTAEELAAALREGVRTAKFVPVLCGAAGRAIGLHPLLDAIVDLLPSPADLKPWTGDNPKTGDSIERAADPAAPFSAFVFKTIVDPFAGRLSVLRIVSGRIHADLNCINSARDVRERIGHPLKLEG